MCSTGFTVSPRGDGHWDISDSDHGRLFRIRGSSTRWWVADERTIKDRRLGALFFADQSAAMTYVCSILMVET